MGVHFPGCTPFIEDPEPDQTEELVSLDDLDAPFCTPDNVQLAISQFGPDKAAGPDGLLVGRRRGEHCLLEETIEEQPAAV